MPKKSLHPMTTAIAYWIDKDSKRQVISAWESMALDPECLDECVQVHAELNEQGLTEKFVDCFRDAPPVTYERAQHLETVFKDEMDP